MRSLGEGAGPGNRCAGLVEKDIVAQRSLKIRAVENIEELYPKLSCESIGEEGCVLIDREVQIGEARPNKYIAPCVAAQVKARQRRKPSSSIQRGVLRVVEPDLISI